MKYLIGTMTCCTVLAAAGCSSDPTNVSYSAIAGNISPGLQNMTERPIDIDRNIAMVHDVNLRNFSNDLGRALHLDSPSRLSPYPITSASGQPR